MATALVILAVGSIVAGYVNIPHAWGGHTALNEWLKPVFNVTNCGETTTTGELAGIAIEACTPVEEREPGEHASTEWALMGVSSLLAFAGIGLATFLWLKNKQIPARLAAQYPGVHRLLLNKYYVDEFYDAAIVQPIKVVSQQGLWRGFDVRIIDGAVNGTGALVSGGSAVLRRLQTGSVRAYAGSLFVGVVVVLGYYLWR
jgi:NADH-quinone oxidoreductase subunit L